MSFEKILIYGFIFLGVLHNCSATDCEINDADSLPQDQFISKFTDPCRYDKYERPKATTPLNINVTIDITHLESSLTQFTAYMSLQFVYLDTNLNYEKISPKRTLILGDESLKALIWTPSLELIDQTDTTIIGATSKDVLISINPSGLISYSYKMIANFDCWMDLQKFPFDHQKCDLALTDWSYNATEIQLNLKKLYLAKNLHLTEFVMDEVYYSSDDNAQAKQFNEFSENVGNFSELTIQFKFHRDIGYYLLDFFLPSYLLVFTAWVTFWLQADAGPPRATLGCSTIVAFITLHLGVAKDIPKVSYVKASDIWFLGVTCFIFLSLAEFAFVNVIWRRKKQVKLVEEKPKYILKSAVMPKKARKDLEKYASSLSLSNESLSSDKYQNTNGFYMNSQEQLTGQTAVSMPDDGRVFTWTEMSPQEVAIYVDRKARVVFPFVFLIFNILYWVFVYYA